MTDHITKFDKPTGVNKQVADKSVKYLKDNLTKRRAQYVEDTRRWNKDHPTLPPGYNPKGGNWKTYSRQKGQSEAYRVGFANINWSD